MIIVDESDPVGQVEPYFESRNVIVKKGVDAKQYFDLLTEIGRGKFGTVYKCREKCSGLQFAAKFVPIPKRDDRRNVEREVEIMNSLQHSLIIQLYDAFEYQKMMCVVLELIEGGELFDRVIDDEFLLTEKACTVLMRQLCQAMAFVHRNNIIHLDLKPENILCLTREGNRIKIIDFGLARRYDPEKKLQILFGTPEFVAPEVVNFDRISFGTDMWSVGVICYVLLSGLSPFMGSTDVETMANVTIGKYDFDDEAFSLVSKDALNFIEKLLVKDLSIRMTAEQCLQHPWLIVEGQQQAGAENQVNEMNSLPMPNTPTIAATPPKEEADIKTSKEQELTTTKENLKNFIERWEEHPNSPYVFDANTTLILPTHDTEKNTSSGFSSRCCSPSPCESLSSNLELQSSSSSTIKALDTANDDDSSSNAKPTEEMFNRPSSSTPTNRKNKEYLQSFDRRHSDSNYVVNNHTSNLEKIDLAEEIKKLSERLLLLSSINDELIEYNKTVNDKQKVKSIKLPASLSLNVDNCTETKNLKNAKIMKSENFSRSFNESSTSVTKTSQETVVTSTKTSETVVNDLKNRLKSLDETPSLFKRVVFNDKTKSNSVVGRCSELVESFSTSSSSSTSPFTGDRESRGSAPWPISNKRTKFRVTQLSRDVPVGLSRDVHQTIFLEEAANTTKDCLLHLLDKYNAKDARTATKVKRHQSISVADYGMHDNLENHSISSINRFFQRNVFQQNGKTVRKIQQKIESSGKR